MMVAGTTASRKQKGREHQKQIADDIRKAFNLPPEDVVSRPMGSPGIDVMLSVRARSVFPFGIECKRSESLSIPAWWKQCATNADNLKPLLVYRRNHEPAMAVLRWDDFLEVIQ